MGNACRRCIPRNLDEVFSYRTAHYTKIQDARLGILHKLFMLGIFLYVIVWVIILSKGYLEKEPPLGVVRLSLRRPVKDPSCKPPYCINNFIPPSQLSYCGNGINEPECEFWDAEDAVYPVSEESSMFIATRVTTYNQSLQCDRTDPNCQYSVIGSTRKFYIGDIESFTVRFSHSVRAPSLPVAGNALDMTGDLVKCDKFAEKPDCDHPAPLCLEWKVLETFKEGADTFTLGKLLTAAELDLDAGSCEDPTSPYRYEGVVLVLSIDYDNTKTSDASIHYSYKVQPLSMKYKVMEPQYYDSTGNLFRTTINRHGLRLVVLQTGILGSFTFTALLIQLTTSLTLLAVATTLVDLIALNFLPEKKHYHAHMETTVTISDARRETFIDEHPEANVSAENFPILQSHYYSQDNSANSSHLPHQIG